MLEHSKPNPNWVNAPYSGAALLGVPVPPWLLTWSRKRRQRWIRRKFRQHRVKFLLRRFGPWYASEFRLGILPPESRPMVPILFKRENYYGELDFFKETFDKAGGPV